MNKPFNLEDFKNGQKALTREGLVATFVGIRTEDRAVYEHPDGCLLTVTDKGFWWKNELPSINDLVSMVSRHQHLIDSYDPEDTWQEGVIRHGNLESSTFMVWLSISEPNWDEHREYRLHPHNDLIKAWNKGAKIQEVVTELKEIYNFENTHLGSKLKTRYVDDLNPTWDENKKYRIKPEVTKPTTKTIYEWVVKGELEYWHLNGLLLTEDEAAKEFASYEYKKTGRYWEVEV